MASIFLSHSSKDKEFVKKLAGDLKKAGHTPWLDEYEIKVGDCIETKIEKGIDDAEYIVLVLSSNSIKSNWVDKEWREKYWDEVNKKKVMLLPVLIDECKIPSLIKTKKYANFINSYKIGLSKLLEALPSKNKKPNNSSSNYSSNNNYKSNPIVWFSNLKTGDKIATVGVGIAILGIIIAVIMQSPTTKPVAQVPTSNHAQAEISKSTTKPKPINTKPDSENNLNKTSEKIVDIKGTITSEKYDIENIIVRVDSYDLKSKGSNADCEFSINGIILSTRDKITVYVDNKKKYPSKTVGLSNKDIELNLDK